MGRCVPELLAPELEVGFQPSVACNRLFDVIVAVEHPDRGGPPVHEKCWLTCVVRASSDLPIIS